MLEGKKYFKQVRMYLPMQLTDWLLVEVALLLIGLTLEIILIEGIANVVILKKIPVKGLCGR